MKLFRKFINKELLTVSDGNGKLSVFALAVPLFIELISVQLIGLVQTMMSSRYEGGFFVIPVSVANSVFTVFHSIAYLVVSGMAIVLSIELGRKNTEGSRSIIGTAMIAGAVFSILLSVVGMIFAEPLLRFMGMNKPDYAQYMPYALRYFRYRIAFLIAAILSSVVIAVLRCYGYTRVGLICGLASNGANAIVTAIAMFALKMPKESAVDVLAVISLFSALINVGIAFATFAKRKIRLDFKFSHKWCKKIIGVGAPASVSSVFYNLSQTVTATICLSLTPEAYLAKNYISQLVVFVYQMGFSIGQVNSILVGRVCGMGELDKADKIHRQNLRIVLLCNITLSLLFAVFGRGLTRFFFDADETVVAYAGYVLLLDVIVEIGRGMNHIGQYGLNATGDVRFTTVVSIVSCWMCSVGLAYVFGIVLGWDLYGVWIAFAVDELFRGSLYYIRWRKEGWRKHFLKSGL